MGGVGGRANVRDLMRQGMEDGRLGTVGCTGSKSY